MATSNFIDTATIWLHAGKSGDGAGLTGCVWRKKKERPAKAGRFLWRALRRGVSRGAGRPGNGDPQRRDGRIRFAREIGRLYFP